MIHSRFIYPSKERSTARSCCGSSWRRSVVLSGTATLSDETIWSNELRTSRSSSVERSPRSSATRWACWLTRLSGPGVNRRSTHQPPPAHDDQCRGDSQPRRLRPPDAAHRLLPQPLHDPQRRLGDIQPLGRLGPEFSRQLVQPFFCHFTISFNRLTA